MPPLTNYDIRQFPPEYVQYNTQYPGAKETIGWTWYDTVTFVSATTTQLTFFDIRRANISLSNMEAAGQLPAPLAFFCRAIGWKAHQRPEATTAAATTVTQTGVVDDLAQLSNTGVFSFTVGQKLYGRYPLWKLPSGGGVVPFMQTGDIDVVVDYANNGLADVRNVFTLAKPLLIAPQINFHVDLFWPAVITLALGDTQLECFLDGDLIRPVQ